MGRKRRQGNECKVLLARRTIALFELIRSRPLSSSEYPRDERERERAKKRLKRSHSLHVSKLAIEIFKVQHREQARAKCHLRQPGARALDRP